MTFQRLINATHLDMKAESRPGKHCKRNGVWSCSCIREAISFLLKWFAKHPVDVLMASGLRGCPILHRRLAWPPREAGREWAGVGQLPGICLEESAASKVAVEHVQLR